MINHNLLPTYLRQNICIERGAGVYLYGRDDSGKEKKFLDTISGVAVCSLGHCNAEINNTIKKQINKLIHCSNLFFIEEQNKLAEELTKIAKMDKVFFCNSGAEANETAIKILRKYANNKKIIKPKIICFNNSFHGRTYATLSATDNLKVRQGFEPIMQDFIHVPRNDINAIYKIADKYNIVGIILEPIQGEGGVHKFTNNFLKKINQLANKNNWLIVADEIQSGMMRSGRWFAHMDSGMIPDIMTLGKALGNGFPIAACLTRDKANEVLQPGNHGSTYGGNPLSCAVALATVKQIEKKFTNGYIANKSDSFKKILTSIFSSVDGILDIRIYGLLIGIEVDNKIYNLNQLISKVLERNIIINLTASNVIRLLPPFIITVQEFNYVCKVIREVLLEIKR